MPAAIVILSEAKDLTVLASNTGDAGDHQCRHSLNDAPQDPFATLGTTRSADPI